MDGTDIERSNILQKPSIQLKHISKIIQNYQHKKERE